MRPSTFQRIDIALSRDLVTDYDKIKQIADHIDAIELISTAMEAGVDFGDVANLATDVNALELAMDGKVDKVTGSSLMTDAEHTKLQFIQQQATKNQADVYLLDRVNHTGTQDLDTTTDGVDRFAMTAAERAKLATVEDRANHTGTQSIDTITDGVSKVVMTTAERNKLNGISDSANAYVHPAKHSATIIDGTGEFNKILKTDEAGVVGFDNVSWAEIVGKPSTMTPSAHEHSMDEITSGTIAAARIVMSEGRQFINAEQATAILDMEVKSNKGIPLGYAPLDANGKLNPSYLNDLNLIEVFTPADLNSMLNLNSAQPGDIAYRLDTNNTYMLAALPVNTEANWKQLNAGLSVVSVNGLSGVVNLNTANIAEGGSNYYFTNERVDDRVAALLQAGTNVTLSYDDVDNTLTINANYTGVNWSEIQNKPTTVAGYAISDVSTTSQMNTALALKANLASPTFTGTVVLPATTSIGTITNTKLGYLDGVTSAIQTQIDTKAPLASPTFTGTATLPSTTSIGTITSTELGYLDGVTSAIQTQINAKQATLVSGTNIKTINSNSILGSGNIAISAGISLATANSYDLGVGQTWQDVTASRIAGTTYTNSTGKPIEVLIYSTAGPGPLTFLIDLVSILLADQPSGSYCSSSIVVANGKTYSASGDTITKWYELR